MTNSALNPTSSICNGCRKAAVYTVMIGEMAVCEECIGKAKDKVAFKSWMSKVDQGVISICGLTSDDLPDQTWRDWFDDSIEPEEAAEMALENAGWDG